MEINYNKLTRNYKKYPIKVGEQLVYEDFYYLYWELNLTKSQVSEILGCSTDKIYKFAKQHGLIKSTQMSTQSQKQLLIEKYGVDNIMKTDKAKKALSKKMKTTFELRGKEITDKRKQTCLEKYGCENPSQVKDIKEKKKQTTRKNYGVDNPQQCQEIKQKSKETYIQKYNGFPMCVDSKLYNKTYETILNEYGCDNVMKNKEISKKAGETQKQRQEEYKKRNLEKYGVEYPSKLKEVIDKINTAKSKNGTFNTSQEELEIKCLLENLFHIVYNKTHKPQYPFRCDFYIVELDLYMEYNGSWTHGFRPFNENDKNCLLDKQIMEEKAKNSKYYKNAIETWTIRDVLKRQTAKNNELNWIEFFNMDQFYEWYNNMEKIYGSK